MPVIRGLGWTFDTVASTYEKFRPGYVPELYKMIFEYIPIGPGSEVVEMGSGGTDSATRSSGAFGLENVLKLSSGVSE